MKMEKLPNRGPNMLDAPPKGPTSTERVFVTYSWKMTVRPCLMLHVEQGKQYSMHSVFSFQAY